MQHLVFDGLGAVTEGGGAGGIGSGVLDKTSTGAVTGAGSGSATLLPGFSGAT